MASTACMTCQHHTRGVARVGVASRMGMPVDVDGRANPTMPKLPIYNSSAAHHQLVEPNTQLGARRTCAGPTPLLAPTLTTGATRHPCRPCRPPCPCHRPPCRRHSAIVDTASRKRFAMLYAPSVPFHVLPIAAQIFSCIAAVAGRCNLARWRVRSWRVGLAQGSCGGAPFFSLSLFSS